jgi:DNA-binding NarL/FixJ family response regulator
MNEKPGVIIIEDHPMLRLGIRFAIDRNGGYEVIGETDSGKEAIRLVTEMDPAILILDIELEDMNGLDVVRMLRPNHSAMKIIIYSMHRKRNYIIQAFRLGAQAYIAKNSDPIALIKAMDRAMKEQKYLDTELADEIAQALEEINLEEAVDSGSRYNELSQREREILKLLAEGFSNKEVANLLTISNSTVNVHKRHVMEKLSLESQTELIRYAMKAGIISS